VVRALVERSLQRVRVETRHALNDDPIERLRGRGIVVMGQVGAGNDQRAPAPQRRRQSVAQRAGRGRRLMPHHQRDDRNAGGEMLQERQLHLE
jgi:hypothetical protein